MMRFIVKHGLLDEDFIVPLVAITVLLMVRDMV